MADTELPKILCIDDEIDILESLKRTLRRRFDVVAVESIEKARTILEGDDSFCVVVCDQRLGFEQGVPFLREVKSLLPSTSRVLLSGQIDLKCLEDAINESIVHKFVQKPWENDQLLIHVMEAYKLHRELTEKAQLKMLSITDPVTQLTNHRFFQEKIRIEWEKYKSSDDPLSLIMVDIDHFKKFNDRFGHPEGDKYLNLMAETIQSVAPENASVSRYGGEEFAILISQCSSPQALIHAESIRQKVLETSFNNFPLSISLGVATAPEHADSVDELILSSDRSLLQAKRRGRNQTVVGLVVEQ